MSSRSRSLVRRPGLSHTDKLIARERQPAAPPALRERCGAVLRVLHYAEHIALPWKPGMRRVGRDESDAAWCIGHGVAVDWTIHARDYNPDPHDAGTQGGLLALLIEAATHAEIALTIRQADPHPLVQMVIRGRFDPVVGGFTGQESRLGEVLVEALERVAEVA